MTDSVLPSVIYQPQQIPVTAYYVAQEGDSRRFARSVSIASFKQAVPLVVLMFVLVILYASFKNGLGGALVSAAFLAVLSAVIFPLIGLLTTRRMQKVFEAMGRAGDRSCSRFGTDAVDFENEMSCATYRYADLKVAKVTEHIVVFMYAGAGPLPTPRALVPEHVLDRLRSRR